jgi:hypothetical protein
MVLCHGSLLCSIRCLLVCPQDMLFSRPSLSFISVYLLRIVRLSLSRVCPHDICLNHILILTVKAAFRQTNLHTFRCAKQTCKKRQMEAKKLRRRHSGAAICRQLHLDPFQALTGPKEDI